MNVYMLREGGGDCRIWQKMPCFRPGSHTSCPRLYSMDDSISAHRGGGEGGGGVGGGGEGTYRLDD